jgi:hypothetical protein
MKAIINYLAQPQISFTIVIIMFCCMIKYVEFFAKKAVGWFLMIGTLVGMVYMFQDEFFVANFAMTNDNVPILFLVLLLVWSLWFSLSKGVANDKRIEQGLGPLEGSAQNREKVWAWPNLVYNELFAMILCTAFLIAWAIFFKGPLEESANPTWAPNPAKAPWYFLGLQEMLVYFDPWMAGVALPGLVIVGLVGIPFMDVNPKGNGYYTFKERKMAITIWLFGWLVLWQFLIIIGTFMRGPNWSFYGPFEEWDVHKVEALFNVNLSEIIWLKMFNVPMPKNILIRELFGFIALGAYMFGSGLIFTKFYGQKLLKKMGMIRYNLFLFLLIMMMSLPIKMYLRWAFNLKYVLAMPEFEFNI